MGESTNQAAETTEKPLIWDYRDARAFVADLCSWKAEHERGFSYRKIAKFAGLSAPGYIKWFVDAKRNFKESTARAVGEALALDEDECEHFVVLVAFTQEEDLGAQSGLLAKIVDNENRHGRGLLTAAKMAYFTDWYIPVVHTLASLSNFQTDPEWIAKTIIPNIRPKQADKALKVLQKLEMLAIEPDGSVTVYNPIMETAEGLRNIFIRDFHRSMMRTAERALDLLPRNKKAFNSFIVTVPHGKIQEALDMGETMLRDYFYNILALVDEDQEVEGEALQCNLQGFLVSDTQAESASNP